MYEGISQDMQVEELLSEYYDQQDNDLLTTLGLGDAMFLEAEDDDPDQELEARAIRCSGFCGELTTNLVGMCYECQCVQHELGMIDMEIN